MESVLEEAISFAMPLTAALDGGLLGVPVSVLLLGGLFVGVLALALFLELWVAYEIRDNLTLNIMNLIYQFDFISAWQAGA